MSYRERHAPMWLIRVLQNAIILAVLAIAAGTAGYGVITPDPAGVIWLVMGLFVFLAFSSMIIVANVHQRGPL